MLAVRRAERAQPISTLAPGQRQIDTHGSGPITIPADPRPLGAVGVPGWVLVKSLMGAQAAQNWSLVGIVVVGVAMLFVARFGFRSPFFHIARESDAQES
jgi:hypothetical protein